MKGVLVVYNITKSNSLVKIFLKPGWYVSTVKDVYADPDYVQGSMMKIVYNLENEQNQCFEFEELFATRGTNQRSADFRDYLIANGITDWKDYIGCQEKVNLRKKMGKHKTFLTIAERSFIMEDVDD